MRSFLTIFGTYAIYRNLEGHTGSVTAVVVTNDGNRVISASNNRTLKVWDLETGEHMGCISVVDGDLNNIENLDEIWPIFMV